MPTKTIVIKNNLCNEEYPWLIIVIIILGRVRSISKDRHVQCLTYKSLADACSFKLLHGYKTRTYR